MRSPAQVLEAAVRGLREEQKANLRYHLAVGTRILCGVENELWEGDGGGTPWALAGGRVVGEKRVALFAEATDLYGPALSAFERMRRSVLPDSLLRALDQLTEDGVRAAIEAGLA